MSQRHPSERLQALLAGSEDDSVLRQTARRELRTRMRALRNLVPDEVVAKRSQAVCDAVLAMPEVRAAKVVVGYSAVRREIDPKLALEAALRAGQIVGLPRVLEDGSLVVLRYRGEALEDDHFGVPAPNLDAEPIETSAIDVVLVPALAVDDRGHRLGYGRGYYDRLLSGMPRALSIALVHPFQRVIELADMPGDVPVSWIASEAGLLPSRRD